MSPVITLTTDFGDCGPFVGVMKAVLRRHAPNAEIADLTHRIARCTPCEAGFWLARSYRYFPTGSVHVAVVDPGVGTQRDILACAWDGHLFLAPDNGILPMIVGQDCTLHALAADWPARRLWPAPSRTFHGRDIFAPLAAAFASGTARPGDIGPACRAPAPAAAAPVTVSNNGVTGYVVAIDTWGNLITHIEEDMLRTMQAPRIGIAGIELPLLATYGAAESGALLALINSFGVLEVACREGDAAARLGVRHGTPVTVRESADRA